MTPLFFFECALVACSALITVVGGLHVRAYMTSNAGIQTEADLERYRAVVRFQMWAAVFYLLPIVPAILLGVINGWNEPLSVKLITVTPYWVAMLISFPFRKYEKLARAQTTAIPDLQLALNELSHHWKKGFFPRV